MAIMYTKLELKYQIKILKMENQLILQDLDGLEHPYYFYSVKWWNSKLDSSNYNFTCTTDTNMYQQICSGQWWTV